MTDKKWTVKHDAEGYAVIAHDDYGNVPAWTERNAKTIAGLLNDGPAIPKRKYDKFDQLIALLLVVFVAQKLTNQIDWSWLWVLSPLWVPIAIGAVWGGYTSFIARKD